MAAIYRVTTADNPYDPWTNWDEWYLYDISKGYNTCERLARLAKVSFVLPDEAREVEINNAIDQLVFDGAFDKNGIFVKYIKIEKPKASTEKIESQNK